MHLTQAQRYEIAALLKTNTPQKKIAEVIGANSYFEVLGEKATHIKLTEVN